jgi:signal peptidase I
MTLSTPEFEGTPDSSQQSRSKNSIGTYAIELLQTIVLAFILYFAIDSVIARVRVENISMEPTLKPGEFIVVNKFAYRFSDIQRGDIIIFHYPEDPTEDFIKRVIGLPGEMIDINHGEVFINEHLITEPYIITPPLYVGSWQIPENAVFVLGDNRNQSSDSHTWGFLPVQNVVGKALVIYWPVSEFKILTHSSS